MKLLQSKIEDPYLRECLKRVEDYVNQQGQLDGFKHIDLLFDGPVDHFKYFHGFGFVPKDVLVTMITGTGVLTFNYDLFDSKFMDISTSGPCRVRAFVGTYKNSGVTRDG